MKKNQLVKSAFTILALCFLFGLFVSPAQAFEPRQGDQVVIPQGEVIDDDLYVSANVFRLEGTIKGDLIAFGSLVVIESTGVVEGDLLAAGQGVVVKGVVKDDARLAGMVVKVESGARIGDDLLAAGYSVEAASGSAVGGDVVAAGSVIALSGQITEDVWAAAEGVELNGQIGGDVKATVGGGENAPPFSPFAFMPKVPGMPSEVRVRSGLTIGSQAQIEGNLEYTAPSQNAIPAEAVSGVTTYSPLPAAEQKQPAPPPTPLEKAGKWFLGLLRNLATLLLVGLLFSFLAPKLLRSGAAMLKSKPLPSFGWGLVVLFGFFFLLFALVVIAVTLALILGIFTLGELVWTVIGAYVAATSVLVLSFKITASYLTKVLVAFLIGYLIFSRFKPELVEHRFWPALLGILIFTVLVSIPVLGGLLSFLAVLAGLGAFYLLFRQWIASRKQAQLVESI